MAGEGGRKKIGVKEGRKERWQGREVERRRRLG